MSDYLTIEDLEELRNEASKRKRLYLAEWPDPIQCEVRTALDRCPNRAVYRLFREDRKPADICDSCLPSWVHEFTKHSPVTIVRSDADTTTSNTSKLTTLVRELAKLDLGCYGDCRFRPNVFNRCLSCQATALLAEIDA